jgi:hypothetical protein
MPYALGTAANGRYKIFRMQKLPVLESAPFELSWESAAQPCAGHILSILLPLTQLIPAVRSFRTVKALAWL